MPTNTTYNYTSQYIPASFWSFLNDRKVHRIRLLKDTTGCGATYGVMLTETELKRVIVMPTINLIEDKQQQAKDGHFGLQNCISLHSMSPHVHTDCHDADIILCTPDQLVAMYKNNRPVWDALKTQILVQDEEHTAEAGVVYRRAFSELNWLLETEWEGSVITITATKPFTTTPFLSTFDTIQLINPTRPEQEVYMTQDLESFWGKFQEYYYAGEKIVLVSNDIKQYNRMYRKNVHTITGSNLELKLRFNGFDTEGDYLTKQIVILSTSATEGIDLNIQAHVMILSDFKYDYTTFTLQTIIQSLGRPRLGLLESVCCVLPPEKDLVVHKFSTLKQNTESMIDFTVDCYTHEDQLRDELQKLHRCMLFEGKGMPDTQLICGQIGTAMNSNLFKRATWIRDANVYSKFNKIKFKRLRVQQGVIPALHKFKFKENVAVYLNYAPDQLQRELFQAVLNIRGAKYGSASKNLSIAMLTAIGIQKCKCPIITQQLLDLDKPIRAIKVLNGIILGQKSCTLRTTALSNTSQSTRLLPKLQVLRANLDPFISSTKAESNASLGRIKTEYQAAGVCFTDRQQEIIQVISYLMSKNTYNKTLISDHIDLKHITDPIDEKEKKTTTKTWFSYMKDMAGLVLNDCTMTRQDERATRTYSAITGLPIAVIFEAYPYDVIEIDITSANPMFIDTVTGSKLASIIYAEIMRIDNLTRDDAKIAYNKLLNMSWAHEERYSDLVRWGYTKKEAQFIIDNSRTKGFMYYVMTHEEKHVIHKMEKALTWENSIRRHDSILLFGQRADLELQIVRFRGNCDQSINFHINKSY